MLTPDLLSMPQASYGICFVTVYTGFLVMDSCKCIRVFLNTNHLFPATNRSAYRLQFQETEERAFKMKGRGALPQLPPNSSRGIVGGLKADASAKLDQPNGQ